MRLYQICRTNTTKHKLKITYNHDTGNKPRQSRLLTVLLNFEPNQAKLLIVVMIFISETKPNSDRSDDLHMHQTNPNCSDDLHIKTKPNCSDDLHAKPSQTVVMIFTPNQSKLEQRGGTNSNNTNHDIEAHLVNFKALEVNM